MGVMLAQLALALVLVLALVLAVLKVEAEQLKHLALGGTCARL
jgi:hypothetical protein